MGGRRGFVTNLPRRTLTARQTSGPCRIYIVLHWFERRRLRQWPGCRCNNERRGRSSLSIAARHRDQQHRTSQSHHEESLCNLVLHATG